MSSLALRYGIESKQAELKQVRREIEETARRALEAEASARELALLRTENERLEREVPHLAAWAATVAPTRGFAAMVCFGVMVTLCVWLGW